MEVGILRFFRWSPVNFCGRSKYPEQGLVLMAEFWIEHLPDEPVFLIRILNSASLTGICFGHLPVLYLSVKLWVMKDFVKVLIMPVLVFASMAVAVYINYGLDAVFLSILAAVLALVILVVVYRTAHRWLGLISVSVWKEEEKLFRIYRGIL